MEGRGEGCGDPLPPTVSVTVYPDTPVYVHMWTVRWLVCRPSDQTCDVNYGSGAPIREAAAAGSARIAQLLLEAGADPLLPEPPQIGGPDFLAPLTRFGQGTAVHVAASYVLAFFAM